MIAVVSAQRNRASATFNCSNLKLMGRRDLAISLPYVVATVNILLTLLGFGALLMRAYKSWLGRSALELQGA